MKEGVGVVFSLILESKGSISTSGLAEQSGYLRDGNLTRNSGSNEFLLEVFSKRLKTHNLTNLSNFRSHWKQTAPKWKSTDLATRSTELQNLSDLRRL